MQKIIDIYLSIFGTDQGIYMLWILDQQSTMCTVRRRSHKLLYFTHTDFFFVLCVILSLELLSVVVGYEWCTVERHVDREKNQMQYKDKDFSFEWLLDAPSFLIPIDPR